MKKIQEIKDKMRCPKDFKCMESSPENICKAMDFGHKNYLECLDSNYKKCKFVVGDDHSETGIRFCSCPLRKYVAKNLKS